MKKIKQSKTCYIVRGWYYGNSYYYVDSKTKEASRDFNWLEQCIDVARENGYTIIEKDKK